MKCFYDLHIHTALSPCASEDMTPNNIVNMAQIKGLDVIAITDHNSALNVGAVMECAQNTDLLVVPGMELETSEEVHMLCLFPTLNAAEAMGAAVRKRLRLKNRPDIFGEQLIIDALDNIIGAEENMLISATDMNIFSAAELVTAAGGIILPAHIDRPAYSILSNLGFIPQELHFNTLEASKNVNLAALISAHPELFQYRLITNSDAHNLEDISEREHCVDLREKSIQGLLEKLLNS